MIDKKEDPKEKDPAAVSLGRKGGLVKSEAKTKACRENARKKRRRRVILPGY